jgi:hypothetical protein
VRVEIMKLLTGRSFRDACSPLPKPIMIREAGSSSETSVLFYQIAQYQIPDDSKKYCTKTDVCFITEDRGFSDQLRAC